MTNPNQPDIYFTLANHWSYTGIGWQLGLESCAESIADSLRMADYDPGVRTGLNLDALAYELVAEKYPEVIERLKRYLDEGRVEIIGGTFGQPMGSMVSGESNLRQLVVGQQTIRKALGQGVAVFLEEEEMSHPQVPQLVTLAGYKYASLAQCDTWGRHGAPKIAKNIIRWEGVDGTQIIATPSNAMVFHPPCVTHDIDWLWSEAGRAGVQQMNRTGQPPLIVKWTEFGWEELSGKAINKFDPQLFKELSAKFRVEYVTIEQYLDRHRGDAGEPVRLRMNDFEKLLPWGVGGDQIRRFGREVEAVLVAAERFDAAAHALGLQAAPIERLDQAWRHLLASQSHDVSLCEYSRWQGQSPPREPIFDAHFLTWGAMGYRHMDQAMALGRPILEQSLTSIAHAINTRDGSHGTLAAVVFNPCGFDRDTAVTTGKIPLAGRDARGLRVRNGAGREVRWQLLKHGRDDAGMLLHADIAFLAADLPGLGYDTFYLETTSDMPSPPTTELRVDEAALRLENASVAVTLDPVSGAIASLVDRRTGKNLIDGQRRAFPTLTGRPNPAVLPAKHSWGVVDAYDSSKSQAQFTWVEKGPLRATVRASHPPVRGMRFEIYVTLLAHSPTVHVHARFFPDMPPKADDGKINGWQLELDINEGYWLEFAPAFEPAIAIRDYPFGVEACDKKAIDALTFVDLIAADGTGLMIAHSGTQYFKRLDDGVIANLAVREWESGFTGEYGWPRVCEYRYALTPHGKEITDADRARLSSEPDHKPRCVVLPPGDGKLPRRQSFVHVDGDGVLLSAFRRRSKDAFELRVFECGNVSAVAKIATSLPFTRIQPTDALGEPAGAPVVINQPPGLSLRPWEVKTFELMK